ncbi:MAG TPA: amino acid adenylation domain-containing protein, partial [Thermoanaerobaculia bacterium]|nr:amino acid adenylation domain-containing protein [Thermoanaerobaculia bacterium]
MLLARCRRTVAAALDHQELPFPLLAERLQTDRTSGHSPLFQAMLVLYRARRARERGLGAFALGEEGQLQMGRLTLAAVRLAEPASQVDLTLRAAELEGDLALSLQYATDLFEPVSIRRLLGQLKHLLAAAVADPSQPLSTLPLLSPAERAQLLTEWNATEVPWPADRDLYGLFALQAARRPESIAVEMGAGPLRLTYGELARRVERLSGHLSGLGVGPEARVGVLLSRSPEMVIALLAVLAAGGSYLPLDPAYPEERLSFVLSDAGAALLLTEGRWAGRVPADVPALLLDSLPPATGQNEPSPRRPADAHNLAYVIYTSGSTGRPKGVAIEHRSAVAFLSWAGATFAPEELSSVLAATSICFDLSVFELFAPLCHGGRVILVRDALELAALSPGRGITLLNTVPSAASELARAGGIPASVRTICLAGEPVSRSLADRLLKEGAERRVLDLYGPSEDTTYSTWTALAAGREPSIGRPVANTRVYLLDRHLTPVPLGAVGEIHLAGAGLARGYLGRPELTAERFVPDPFGEMPGGRLYRTGDLGRYLPDGELSFLGRNDAQIKLRGYRVELGEIEATLAEQPGVREAVVLARQGHQGDGRDDIRLVAYVVAEGESGAEALRSALRRRLPAFLLPGAFVLLPALPRNSNGKVDRGRLPAPAGEGARRDDAPAPPRTPVEEVLAGIWAEVIGIDRVGIHDGFFDLGGHSLLGTRVLARVREAWGVDLPLERFFELPTVAAFAAEVERARQSGRVQPLTREDGNGPFPLSFAQRRLWFLDRLAPASAVYNVPLAVDLDGPFDPLSFVAAFARIVDRHAMLRARFAERGGEPEQEISAKARCEVPRVDLTGLPSLPRRAVAAALAEAEARRPFDLVDLGDRPAWRALLLKQGGSEHTFLLTLHHAVCDAWSIRILLHELGLFYEANRRGESLRLPESPVEYRDYCQWQRSRLDEPAFARERAAARARLAGLSPLSPPADRPRPRLQSFLGAARRQSLPAALGEAVRRLGHRSGATLFMTLAAAFETLLFRLSGQSDVVHGSPVAGRTRPELEGLVGLFVNTLVLRVRLSPGMSFADAVAQARTAALAAYAGQDLPFELLVEDLEPVRDLGSTPLFQTFFALQNVAISSPFGGKRSPSSELALLPRAVDTGTAKFDLSLFVWENRAAGAPGLDLEAEYATDLYDGATIDRLLGQWIALLEAAVAEPELEVADLPLLGAAERFQVAVEWNDSPSPAAPVPDPTLYSRFGEQVARTPEAIALIAGESSLSYRELARWAERLAVRLRALGVGPEVRVALWARRRAGLIAGLLAVLRAGGAYVPLDPGYPRRRIADILTDSGAAVVLVDRELASALPGHSLPQVFLDATAGVEERGEGEKAGAPARPAPENLAYLIYTSGSTGRPKGVAIEHRSATALLRWAEEAFDAAEIAAVLAATSIGFDLSVFEIFVPLTRGGTVVLADGLLDLPTLPTASRVTLLNTVPSVMAELARMGAVPPSVQTVNLAGEPLPAALLRGLFQLPGVERVRNLYGPSEDTTYSTCCTFHPVQSEAGKTPAIGRPITGTQAYLLDSRFRLLPPGIPGELFLGGRGLARGYLGRPELTAERFIPDPFAGVERAGGRLYRTGDLVRQRPDGALEFLGRLDHQVKIRG